jgi:hypothetical protein
MTGQTDSGPFITLQGNFTGYEVALMVGCISIERKRDGVKVYVSPPSGDV